MLRALCVLALAGSASSQDVLGPEFAARIRPTLEYWCYDCHAGDDPEADFDLGAFPGERSPLDQLLVLRELRGKVGSGEMPPPDDTLEGMPPEQRAAVVAWANERLAAGARHVRAAPGRVTVRRLSRPEYDRTVRDLFGVATPLSAGFPADDLGYGFDNIGAALSFTELHLEKVQAAAADIAARVADTVDPDDPPVRRIEAEHMGFDGGGRRRDDHVHMYSRAVVTAEVELPRAGRYRVRVWAWGDQAGDEPARMGVRLGRRRLRVVDVPATRDEPGEYSWVDELPAGRQRLALRFVNDFYRKDGPQGRLDRNLAIDALAIEGPLDVREPPVGARWLHAADPGEGGLRHRARTVTGELLGRAWRRPPTSAEVNRVTALVADTVEEGGTFGAGLRLAVEAALTSPHFLFRWEPGGRGGDGDEVLGDHALASRLSYFLWSSMPDERLRARAAAGELGDVGVLVEEARRMLRDPRAGSLATHFAAQWLELRNLASVQPDPDRFPVLTEELRADLRRESELLFLAVLREGLDVRRLLDADFTHLNGRLARHYGIDGIEGGHLRRVPLPEGRRRGILGHASVLTVTSNPTRTSPVKRGKWVLENLLDAPPPAPPPGVDTLDDEAAAVADAASLREQLRAHRDRAECASCHRRMDALGFALERYDAVGRWRARDDGTPVDATGNLPDGRRIDGARELAGLLAGEEAFVRCLLRKLFVYAVGRDAAPADLIVLEGIAAGLPEDRITLEDLILAVVRMDAFHHRSTGSR